MGEVGTPGMEAESPATPAEEKAELVKVQPASPTLERQSLRADLDIDLDGVVDNLDECPNTPGDVAVDAFGCPVPLYVSTSVTFQSNQVATSEEMFSDVARIGRLLQQNPKSMIIIEGHTDDIGEEQANLALSEQRAKSVMGLLTQQYGVAPSRIKTIGYGESRPLVSNATESGRGRNRRVQLTVNGYYRSETSYIALNRPYTIHFASGQSDIRGDFKEKVDDLGLYLSENPETRASIVGYTDNSGSPEINLHLSLQRAEAIKQYLQETFAIAPERLGARGLGEQAPLADNDTEQGRFKNRRVTITVKRDPNAQASSFSAQLSRGRVDTTTYTPLEDNINIRFKAHKGELDTHSMSEVDAVGLMLQKSPDLKITIEGHAQSGLDHEQNMRLSRLRAENVKRYLQSRYDISAERLHVIGYGSDLPVADAGNSETVQIKIDRF